MDQEDLTVGIQLIRKDFNLDESEFSNPEELTPASLLTRLKKLVNYLLEKDFGNLLQVLYRIDISEEKLKMALASNEDEPATLIARMIFDREMQKVATRKKYRNL